MAKKATGKTRMISTSLGIEMDLNEYRKRAKKMVESEIEVIGKKNEIHGKKLDILVATRDRITKEISKEKSVEKEQRLREINEQIGSEKRSITKHEGDLGKSREKLKDIDEHPKSEPDLLESEKERILDDFIYEQFDDAFAKALSLYKNLHGKLPAATTDKEMIARMSSAECGRGKQFPAYFIQQLENPIHRYLQEWAKAEKKAFYGKDTKRGRESCTGRDKSCYFFLHLPIETREESICKEPIRAATMEFFNVIEKQGAKIPPLIPATAVKMTDGSIDILDVQ